MRWPNQTIIGGGGGGGVVGDHIYLRRMFPKHTPKVEWFQKFWENTAKKQNEMKREILCKDSKQTYHKCYIFKFIFIFIFKWFAQVTLNYCLFARWFYSFSLFLVDSLSLSFNVHVVVAGAVVVVVIIVISRCSVHCRLLSMHYDEFSLIHLYHSV